LRGDSAGVAKTFFDRWHPRDPALLWSSSLRQDRMTNPTGNLSRRTMRHIAADEMTAEKIV